MSPRLHGKRPEGRRLVLDLIDAVQRTDSRRVDLLTEELGGGRALVGALLTHAALEERARLRELLPGTLELRSAQLRVAALAPHGPPALWAATEWIFDALPGRERNAPSRLHEQWDALLEIHRERPESPWLPIELVASLSAEQRALGRRIVLGLERRFGARARRVAEARLRLGAPPLGDLLEWT